MKILGIDFGSKNIGLALSDESQNIAFPKEVLKNDKNTIQILLDIIEKENIVEIVIGESLNQEGEANETFFKVEDFILEIRKHTDIKISKEKEFFTSFEAHDRLGKERFNDRKVKITKTENLDAKAARVILQRFLDRKNIKN